MNKVFSIIIPTYNCSSLLKLTVESILKQDMNLYECLIIDGGSKDDTLNVIKDYVEKYKGNFMYISEKDNGIYDAMNKGIKLAKGEYLYFIGAGDTLETNCLANVKERLRFDTELVYGNVFVETRKKLIGNSMTKEDMMFFNICHQAIFYNKNIFKLIGDYNLKYKIYSDNEFNKRCFCNDLIKTRYIDILICNYLGSGISDMEKDEIFDRDYYNILVNNFGINVLKNIFENIKNKKIIGWGTSGGYTKIKEMIDFKIKYFVDSDCNKQGKKIDNIEIFSPQILESEDKLNSYILIFSEAYFDEINRDLQSYGYVKYKDYCLCTSQILNIIKNLKVKNKY